MESSGAGSRVNAAPYALRIPVLNRFEDLISQLNPFQLDISSIFFLLPLKKTLRKSAQS